VSSRAPMIADLLGRSTKGWHARWRSRGTYGAT
jgi:hypothetical protein